MANSNAFTGRTSYGAGIHRNHDSRYFDDFGLGYPPIPCPMDWADDLTIKVHSRTELWARQIPIPPDLSEVVYKLDLWMCFKAILKYFEVLKEAAMSSDLRSFESNLPDWAWPGGDYSEGFLLHKEGNEKWILVVPHHFCQQAFSEEVNVTISLHYEHNN